VPFVTVGREHNTCREGLRDDTKTCVWWPDRDISADVMSSPCYYKTHKRDTWKVKKDMERCLSSAVAWDCRRFMRVCKLPLMCWTVTEIQEIAVNNVMAIFICGI